MKKLFRPLILFIACCSTSVLVAQESFAKKPIVSLWDGMVVAGYVDRGGFVNFGGPTLKLVHKPFSFGIGILPTMRIKEDKVAKGAMKNSWVTPTAGMGLTFIYKHLAVQLPLYYNPKTATSNGRWNPGIGIGYKF